MKCSAYIAMSFDGFIADENGGIEWLQEGGDQNADMSAYGDMGFSAFVESVDCMVMGRKCMDVVASMNLTDEQWPYGDLPIYVLSRSLTEVPPGMDGRVQLWGDGIPALMAKLEKEGRTHAYVDGGSTITSFLNLQLMTELRVTQIPVLLGKGVRLFGTLDNSVSLIKPLVTIFPNELVQVCYNVDYK